MLFCLFSHPSVITPILAFFIVLFPLTYNNNNSASSYGLIGLHENCPEIQKTTMLLFVNVIFWFMDFINNNIRKMNMRFPYNFDTSITVPKRNLSELERLNDQIFESIKSRSYNMLSNDRNDSYPSFEKLVHQTQGKDTSPASELTNNFRKTIKDSLNI